jgi:hypothetical protein
MRTAARPMLVKTLPAKRKRRRAVRKNKSR